MACLYLTRDGRRIGVNKIFDGIKNFIQNSQTARKTIFHFTMTYFWIQMIEKKEFFIYDFVEVQISLFELIILC